MTEVLKKLRRMEFPRCSQHALDYIVGNLKHSEGEAGIPGLGDSAEEISSQIAREFVFCEVNGKGQQKAWLSPIQELQLLELLLQQFNKMSTDQNTLFKILFQGARSPEKSEFLHKMVSMAISIKCNNCLNATATWMQSLGCSSEEVLNLAQWLVQDYCVLVPQAMPVLHTLPSLSPHFTCNLITTLTMLYKPKGSRGKHKEVWLELLDLLMGWMHEDSQLCLVSLCQAHAALAHQHRSSLWTSPTKPNTQTPIPGLVRWVTQAPLLQRLADHKTDDVMEARHQQSWSRLHLIILHTIQSFPTLPGANQLELITLADMNRIIREAVCLMKDLTGQQDLDDLSRHMQITQDTALQTSTHRLVQILQVALATGAFRCSLGDLQNIINSIPRNKLLDILQIQHLARTPPPMHYEVR